MGNIYRSKTSKPWTTVPKTCLLQSSSSADTQAFPKGESTPEVFKMLVGKAKIYLCVACGALQTHENTNKMFRQHSGPLWKDIIIIIIIRILIGSFARYGRKGHGSGV